MGGDASSSSEASVGWSPLIMPVVALYLSIVFLLNKKYLTKVVESVACVESPN